MMGTELHICVGRMDDEDDDRLNDDVVAVVAV